MNFWHTALKVGNYMRCVCVCVCFLMIPIYRNRPYEMAKIVRREHIDTIKLGQRSYANRRADVSDDDGANARVCWSRFYGSRACKVPATQINVHIKKNCCFPSRIARVFPNMFTRADNKVARARALYHFWLVLYDSTLHMRVSD